MSTSRSSRLRLWGVCALVLGLMCASAATAQAQPQNKRTTVTFSAPFEVPGPKGAMVLPAGTYVFKLLDTTNDRSVVQIFNKDESKLFTTILAIPNYRLQRSDEVVMTFAERSAGGPQALRAWFCPGDNWGQEFVYPRSEAVALAAATQQPVLYEPEPVKPVTTQPEPVKPPDVPVKAVTATGADVPITQVVTPPPTTPPPVMPEKTLPRTASSLPMIAWLGLFALGVGVSVRMWRWSTAR